MLKRIIFNLQLFGDGGEGGDGGSAEATGEVARIESTGEENLSRIPERAKKNYKKALDNHKANMKEAELSEPETTKPETATDMSYADMIKSDKYKDEHKAYMEKAIGERLKKYKSMEEGYGKQSELLNIVAAKYGIDPNSENFLDSLKSQVDADNSYYENYAMSHDMPVDEARRIITMEQKVSQIEAANKLKAEQDKANERVQIIMQNAEKTKAQFANFDIDAEMQNEKFRRLVFANQGDTTAAYMACHWNEIIPATVQMAQDKVRQQTVNAIASNSQRPIENGVSSVAPSVVTQTFKGMSLDQLRAYAAEQKRHGGR